MYDYIVNIYKKEINGNRKIFSIIFERVMSESHLTSKLINFIHKYNLSSINDYYLRAYLIPKKVTVYIESGYSIYSSTRLELTKNEFLQIIDEDKYHYRASGIYHVYSNYEIHDSSRDLIVNSWKIGSNLTEKEEQNKLVFEYLKKIKDGFINAQDYLIAIQKLEGNYFKVQTAFITTNFKSSHEFVLKLCDFAVEFNFFSEEYHIAAYKLLENHKILVERGYSNGHESFVCTREQLIFFLSDSKYYFRDSNDYRRYEFLRNDKTIEIYLYDETSTVLTRNWSSYDSRDYQRTLSKELIDYIKEAISAESLERPYKIL